MPKILITGAAGFIGFHLSKRLLHDGHVVTGLDNLCDYYDVNLKQARILQLIDCKDFTFVKEDIADRIAMEALFRNASFDVVVNLAGQTGVRYSLKNPYPYIDSNIVGFLNVIESCRHTEVKHLVFASSSSVYGINTKIPFSVSDNADHPLSLYAASKKANELMAHTYAYLYGLPCTGLRLFTVYGPWGRPDMGYFSFTKSIMEGKPIDVFNSGNMKRDFTYIDDIVEGIVRVIGMAPQPNPHWDKTNPDPGSSCAPYKLYNIGNNKPIELLKFIEILESNLDIKAKINMLPMQLGEVQITFADVDDLMKEIGFKPSTSLEEGIGKFIEWYKEYYNKKNK